MTRVEFFFSEARRHVRIARWSANPSRTLRIAMQFRALAKEIRARKRWRDEFVHAASVPYSLRMYHDEYAQARAEICAVDPQPRHDEFVHGCWISDSDRVCEDGTKGCARKHPRR